MSTLIVSWDISLKKCLKQYVSFFCISCFKVRFNWPSEQTENIFSGNIVYFISAGDCIEKEGFEGAHFTLISIFNSSQNKVECKQKCLEVDPCIICKCMYYVLHYRKDQNVCCIRSDTIAMTKIYWLLLMMFKEMTIQGLTLFTIIFLSNPSSNPNNLDTCPTHPKKQSKTKSL